MGKGGWGQTLDMDHVDIGGRGVHNDSIMVPLLTDSRLDMMLSRTSGHWGREGEVEGGHKHRLAPPPRV